MTGTPAVIVVSQGGGGAHRTITAAVAAARPGARIVVLAGIYDEQVVVEHDLELVADGSQGSVRIVASSACLTVASGSVTVRGLALWQGQPKPGGLGRLLGRGTAPEPVRAANVAPNVAAIQVKSGHLRLEDCAISAASGLAIGTGSPNTRLEVVRTQIRRVTGGIAVLGGATAVVEDCEFSEWVFDALWASRPTSRLEVRRCTFWNSPSQAVYVDGAATAVVEACDIANVRAGVFVADGETEALLQANTIEACSDAGIMIGDGARAVADGNVVRSSTIGVLAANAGTRIEVTGGRLEGNRTGLGVGGGAFASAAGVAISAGEVGATVGGRGSCLELRGGRISGVAGFGVVAREGAQLVVEDGEVADCDVGVLGDSEGTDVTCRRVRVHGSRGPGIQIGAGVLALAEGNEVFDNAFPGIVTIGGRVRALDNHVHDNRSNGIAIRGAGDAVVEGNDLWGNDLPAITVVGAGTHAVVRENTVRDNAGQGIYVYEGASADVIANRLRGNGRAAITVSDRGSGGLIERNVVEASGGAGIWVADGATATIDDNEVRGSREAGIFVNEGARVKARGNLVRDASIGIVVENAGGNFVQNRLTGNAAGSWALIGETAVIREDNEEETLALPDWAAASLDHGRYALLALRVGAEMGIPPAEVDHLGSSMALSALAEVLLTVPISDYGDLVQKHLATQREALGEAGAVIGSEFGPEHRT